VVRTSLRVLRLVCDPGGTVAIGQGRRIALYFTGASALPALRRKDPIPVPVCHAIRRVSDHPRSSSSRS